MTLVLQPCPQFVKLSDLECQKPRVDINFTPRMSRSIPESSWVESPLLMSHSVGYRSAPHPLEPETSETNSDSDSVSNVPDPQRKSFARKLGTDLLRMFLEEIGPDVTVEVEGHKLKAHKCILASRCQYFAALLSGNWLEKSGNVISLQVIINFVLSDNNLENCLQIHQNSNKSCFLRNRNKQLQMSLPKTIEHQYPLTITAN